MHYARCIAARVPTQSPLKMQRFFRAHADTLTFAPAISLKTEQEKPDQATGRSTPEGGGPIWFNVSNSASV
jgi:hypothetical protein